VVLQLRVPTNRTVEGPRLEMARGRLVVGYDFEEDDGSIEQARLVFEEVLSFEYRDSACCPAENVLPPTEVRVQDQSGYLDSVRSRWVEAAGWQDWQSQQGGAARFKHFTVYFDDAACLDVIASLCHAKE
jgi:hypothetical protein